MIVTQAREPLFYRDLGVPDTVNGRFDLLVLHLWMVLRRLKPMRGRGGPVAGAVRSLLRRYGRQSARNGGRRSHRPEAHAGLRGGVLRPGGGLRSRLDRGPGAAGAGAVQEYPERRGNRKRAAACRLCRGGHRGAGRTGRGDVAGRIVEISLAGAGGAYSNEQNDRHDRQGRSLARSRRRGANTGDRIASRHRGRPGRARGHGGSSAACAKFSRPVLRSM